ncbi:hypothetical protein TNCV_4074851 [Trichonephila clavipes]|nr:hypothetical protein TNCV_4074851 [Trichonephila clavipes]
MCRNQSSVKEENHYVSRSVRKGSWFQLSNMDMCTVLSVMRKWFGRCPQKYAVTDLGVGSHTAVDWYNFCRNTTHRTEDMFDSYLHEFMWRWKNSHSVENEVFKTFLADVASFFPPLEQDVPPELEIIP